MIETAILLYLSLLEAISTDSSISLAIATTLGKLAGLFKTLAKHSFANFGRGHRTQRFVIWYSFIQELQNSPKETEFEKKLRMAEEMKGRGIIASEISQQGKLSGWFRRTVATLWLYVAVVRDVLEFSNQRVVGSGKFASTTQSGQK